jgi:hypothetical protein
MARKKAEAPPAPKPPEEKEKPVITLMRATLGMDQFGNLFRNSYCAENDGPAFEQFVLLETAGVAERFDTYDGRYTYFRLTPAAADYLTKWKVKPKDITDATKAEQAEKERRAKLAKKVRKA